MATKAGRIHAHHIVYKEGTGTAAQAADKEAKDILLYYGINPYWDQANLMYGGNPGGHSGDIIIALDAQLRAVLGQANGQDLVIAILKQAANQWFQMYG